MTLLHSIRMFVAVAGISVLAWSTVPALAQAPFRGERLMYDVRWSATLARLTAGSGALEVSPSPNGGSVYSVVCEARLTPALASLYYRAETMAAARTLLPLQGTIHNQIGEQPAHEILRVGATGATTARHRNEKLGALVGSGGVHRGSVVRRPGTTFTNRHPSNGH